MIEPGVPSDDHLSRGGLGACELPEHCGLEDLAELGQGEIDRRGKHRRAREVVHHVQTPLALDRRREQRVEFALGEGIDARAHRATAL